MRLTSDNVTVPFLEFTLPLLFLHVLVCLALVVSALAEPPVDNRYLPPQQDSYRTTNQESFAPPSQSYGAPGAPGGNFGGQRQTDAVFGRSSSGGRPSSSYGTPQQQQRRPSPQYGAPGRNQPPSQQYGPPQGSRYQSEPSTSYGAPNQGNSRQGLSNTYGAPNQGSRQGLSNTYGAPNQGKSSQAGLSQSYEAPDAGYLPPGGNRRGGYGGDDEGNGEPANYNFEYMVKDDESGNDFGHRESRMGDRAEGRYYVLLPDGRKQTVEYEADKDGYRPKISYEDTGAGAGYDRNSQDQGGSQGGYQQGGNQGYQQGGSQGYQQGGSQGYQQGGFQDGQGSGPY